MKKTNFFHLFQCLFFVTDEPNFGSYFEDLNGGGGALGRKENIFVSALCSHTETRNSSSLPVQFL